MWPNKLVDLISTYIPHRIGLRFQYKIVVFLRLCAMYPKLTFLKKNKAIFLFIFQRY